METNWERGSGRFIGPLARLRNSLVTWHSCERDKEISVKQPPTPPLTAPVWISSAHLQPPPPPPPHPSTHTCTFYINVDGYKMEGSELRSSDFYEYSKGWARERCCILAVESQVLSGRKHCWSNDRKREWEWDVEGRARGGERYACVCGIWKELLLAVLDIYSFLKQWGVWRRRPAMFSLLQLEQGAFFCTYFTMVC